MGVEPGFPFFSLYFSTAVNDQESENLAGEHFVLGVFVARARERQAVSFFDFVATPLPGSDVRPLLSLAAFIGS